MKHVSLQASKRPEGSKIILKEIRRAEEVPGVIYGGASPLTLKTRRAFLDKILATPETFIVDIDIEGEKEPVSAIIKEVQFNPVTDHIIHVDFLRVEKGRKVKVDLPVKLTGTAPGVIAGGKLLSMLRKVSVLGEPQDLPESLSVDISHLELGQTVKVSSIKVEGVKVLSSPNAGLAVVEVPRAVKQAINEDGGPEKEVVAP